MERVTHEFGPFWNPDSKVLILGSIPSQKSRKEGFYYAHPQNRFWKILSQIYQEETPKTLDEKKNFLTRHKIALWDVLESCDIQGSSDQSIQNAVPNDINQILTKTKIKAIFTTGNKAFQLYRKYCESTTKQKAIPLPSTSPANCKKGIEKILIESYQQIKNYTE